MRDQSRVKQCKIRHVGKHHLMDHRILRQCLVGPDPDLLARWPSGLIKVAGNIDRPHIERLWSAPIIPHGIGNFLNSVRNQLAGAKQLFRARYFRHLRSVFEPFLGLVEGRTHNEYNGTVLYGLDSAGRKTSTFTQSLDIVDNGVLRIASQKKVAV